MKYLTDVNLLLALAYGNQHGHDKALLWYASHMTSQGHTCSIVEIGFLRVSVQAKLQPSVADAQVVLAALKESAGFTLLQDDVGADEMPDYVKTTAEITDGHLVALAQRHGAQIATFDKGIPGALLVS